MLRRALSRTVKNSLAGIATVLAVAAPANAAPVTLYFWGEVDLSPDGGPSDNTFSGSVTWDPAAIPLESETGLASYDPLSYTLIFNGVDYSAPVIGDFTGSGMIVLDDSDLLSGVSEDALAFLLAFGPPFQISGQDGDLAILGVLSGPTSMFSSTGLPGNLDFLGNVTSTFSMWQFEPDAEGQDEFFLESRGTLTVSSEPRQVPEPGTLTLAAFGLAGVLARARRARRSASVN